MVEKAKKRDLRSRRESLEELKKRVRKIISRLRKTYPQPKIALEHQEPLQLLVATILSAQCTDERVNQVTPGLFAKYRTAKDYAEANVAEFEQEIRSTGFFRAKTKSIINCCKELVEKHGGKVPKTMEELVQLPGIGRKTANCVLGAAYGIASGVVVDTHVRRLAQRIGLSKEDDPEKIEQYLMEIVPKKDWIDFGNMLIWHGRRVCQARKPNCPECVINNLCPSAEIFMKTMK
ncbi:MAG: endonuclease III [Bacteroidota bacterium]